ncbi:MAG TPA: penicillin acylase family protein [Gemmatimonadales bacterium]|nr:penicillin acylase family protein [Gemmatimonadales bacterium]
MRRVVGWTLAALVVLAAVAVIAFKLWLKASVPPLGGRERVAGLTAPVTVLWDSLAVPHIVARTDSDLFEALGYLHARDRLFQMDLMRHAAEGRLSELFGKQTVAADRDLRSREIERIGRRRIAAVGPDARRAAEAYSRGVNEWIAHGILAPEFKLLGHHPEPWTPQHSLEIGILEAWDLKTDGGEITRMRAITSLGAAVAAELDPGYPPWGPVIVPAEEWRKTQGRRHPGGGAHQQADGPPAASNAWALGPEHTKSHKPILANDPHLVLRTPSVWYLVAAHAPGYDVVGATIPGLPAIVLGHNARLGWGFTNGMIDDVDYVVEQLTPDSGRYLTAKGWASVAAAPETIRVKGGQPVVYVQRRTSDGPLLATRWQPDSAGSRRALALRWVAQDTSDELTALIRMGRAEDRASFAAALETFRSPEQNVVYADADGHIAYDLAGHVPVRRQGDGRLPLPGWTGAGGWGEDRYLPTSALPHSLDPVSGIIVTANNKIVDDSFPSAIDAFYEPPYRAMRIWELARLYRGMTAQGTAAIQTDQVDVFLRKMAEVVARAALALQREDIATQLRAWDGTMAPDRTEPTLMWSWYEEMRVLVYANRSPEIRPPGPLQQWLLAGQGPWFDDPRTPQHETIDTLAQRALITVLARGRPRKWGDVTTHTMDHPLGSVWLLNTLAGLSIGPLATGGDSYTINVCMIEQPRAPHHCTWGPSLRHVVDFADVDGSGGFILPTGESGNPASPHYRDQTARWLNGQLWRIPVDVRKVVAVDTLVLEGN